jgi:hypothetical protein
MSSDQTSALVKGYRAERDRTASVSVVLDPAVDEYPDGCRGGAAAALIRRLSGEATGCSDRMTGGELN